MTGSGEDYSKDVVILASLFKEEFKLFDFLGLFACFAFSKHRFYNLII